MRTARTDVVRYDCAVCGKPMRICESPVARCRFCREANPKPHVHLRCVDCSPPGWWAAAFLRPTEPDPGPFVVSGSGGVKEAS